MIWGEIFRLELKFHLIKLKTNHMKFVSRLMAICALAGIAFVYTGCKDPETPEVVNEEELITTLLLTFENEITGEIDTIAFRDLDGAGGNAPTQFDTLRLVAGADYHVHTYLYNESVSPADDITIEVEEEGVDHQVFYTTAGVDITFTYEDTDDNGAPIGLHMMAGTGVAGTGTLTVTLKHQPGIKDGNIATGETDVEVAFVAEIE